MKVSAAGARFALFCAGFVRQTKGRWAGEPLLLEGWQLAALSEMLRTKPGAWIEVDDLDDPWEELSAGVELARRIEGKRVYTEGYWQLSKKQGKSTLAAAAGLYFLVADQEPGAEVYAAATARDQARIVFEQAKAYVQASPLLARSVRVYKDVLHVPDTDSTFRVVSADAGKTEGWNPSANIIDELARHKSRDLYDTMTSQTGARSQPFTFVISNAPADTEGICYELFEAGQAAAKKRRGARRDLYFYAPSVPKLQASDRRAWKRANPASWITLDYLEAQARKYPPEVFQRRHLNIPGSGEASGFPEGAWDRLGRPGLEVELAGDVWAGVDLGLRHDTAAVAWASPVDATDPETVLVVGAHVWGLHYDPEKPAPAAHEVVEDTRLPISLVEAFVEEELARRFTLVELAYDPWKFERSAQAFDEAGLCAVVEFPQWDSYMVPATETFYEDIVERRLAHSGDPIVAEHMANAVLAETGRGVRLAKRRARRPMDAATALAIAVARARAALREGAGARPTVSAL